MLDQLISTYAQVLVDNTDGDLDMQDLHELCEMVRDAIVKGNFGMTAALRRTCMILGIRPISHLGIIAFTRAMPLEESEPT
jgi:hypothetical protein